MKKVILVLTVIATALNVNAQGEIKKQVDEMTDKVSYSIEDQLLLLDNAEDKGFVIDPYIKKVKNKLIVYNLIVQTAGLESCNEDNTLIFLFENGDKLLMKSWNKFNCKSVAYFDVTPEMKKKLSTNTIEKIRFTNGYSHKYYTGTPQSDYMVNLYKTLSETNL